MLQTNQRADPPGVGNNADTAANASNQCLSSALSSQIAAASGSTGDTSGAANNVSAEAIGATFEFRIQPLASGQIALAAERPLLVTEVKDTQRVIADAAVQNTSNQFLFGEEHNHTLDESPRLAFVHLTAVGSSSQILEVLRAAIANNANVAAGQTSIVSGK